MTGPRPDSWSRGVLAAVLLAALACGRGGLICEARSAPIADKSTPTPDSEPPGRSGPVPFPADGNSATQIDSATLRRIHDEVQTPFKYGIVLKGAPGELVDCPSVFRHDGHWFMVFVSNKDKVGYQTELARSDDLLHWERLGPILPFAKTGWDAWQGDGGVSLYDYRWDGTHELETYDGRYWLSYIGGSQHGYEPDPLAIGLAWTKTPNVALPWTRYSGNPVLTPSQPDTRLFESVTLYKSTIIHDSSATTGWPYVMFYNGKRKQGNHESIGMAVSKDMTHWTRLGAGPVVDNAPGKPAISGDPQITKIGDVWVMFYFGFRWLKGTTAFDTFACSRDFVHWTKWDGEPLVKPSKPFDKTFAHKPWLLKYDGIVYHFYCALGTEGRVIALATSKPLNAEAATNRRRAKVEIAKLSSRHFAHFAVSQLQ